MKDRNLASRISGGLLALAAGDALGFPWEGRDRQELFSINLQKYGKGRYPAGTWSDDTSLTFCTVVSLLEKDGLDLEDLAQKFAAWLRRGFLTPLGQAIGAGRTTVEAIQRYLAGTPPQYCGGQEERSNGNGSLMRILPVVLFYSQAPVTELLTRVHLASCLTHAHPRSLMACGFYALLVRALLRGASRKEAWEQACRGFSQLYAYYFPNWNTERLHFQRLLQADFVKTPPDHIKANAYVINSLEAACWVFLRARSLAEALENAVRLGDDTDTTAAITGGLAGVHWGLEALPQDLLAGLAKGGKLVKLARNFAQKVEERHAS